MLTAPNTSDHNMIVSVLARRIRADTATITPPVPMPSSASPMIRYV